MTVTFDLQNIIEHPVERIRDMPQQQREMIWFQERDYVAMDVDLDESYRLYKSGETYPGRYGHCYRGLESRRQEEYIEMYPYQVRSFAHRSIDAVLKEQQRQQESTDFESDDVYPETIKTIYQAYSILCVTQAIRRGEADRKDAAEEEVVVAAAATQPGGEDFFCPGLPYQYIDIGHDDDDNQSVNSDISMDESIACRSSSLNGKVMGKLRKLMDKSRASMHKMRRHSPSQKIIVERPR